MFASSKMMHGDEDAAATEKMSKDGSQDDEETKFVEWDPHGRFGRVSVDLFQPSFSPTTPAFLLLPLSSPPHPPLRKKERKKENLHVAQGTGQASSLPSFLCWHDECTLHQLHRGTPE